jgi:hypothetical protein
MAAGLAWEWTAEEVYFDTRERALAAHTMWFRQRSYLTRSGGRLHSRHRTDEYELQVLRNGVFVACTDLPAIAAALDAIQVPFSARRTLRHATPVACGFVPVAILLTNRLRGPAGFTDVCAISNTKRMGTLFAVECADGESELVAKLTRLRGEIGADDHAHAARLAADYNVVVLDEMRTLGSESDSGSSEELVYDSSDEEPGQAE